MCGSPGASSGSARSGRFTDVRQTTIERRLVLSAPDYVGHLATVTGLVLFLLAQFRIWDDIARNPRRDRASRAGSQKRRAGQRC